MSSPPPPSQSFYERLRSYFPGNSSVAGSLSDSAIPSSISTSTTLTETSTPAVTSPANGEGIPRSNPMIISPQQDTDAQTSVIAFSYSPVDPSNVPSTVTTTTISATTVTSSTILTSNTPPASPSLGVRKSGSNNPIPEDTIKSPSRTPSGFFRFSSGGVKTDGAKGTIHIQFKTVLSLDEQPIVSYSSSSSSSSSSSYEGVEEGEETKDGEETPKEHDPFLFTTFLDASSSISVVEAMKRKLREVKATAAGGTGIESNPSPLLPRKDSASQQNLPMMKEISLIATSPYDFYLSKLPTELLSMRTLQKLVLERHAISLPSEIGFLCLLEVFKASHCKLKSLPTEFSKLSHLKSLDLSNNNISSLPTTLFNTLTRLEKLKLNHNDLGSLPESIGKLVLLRHLELHNNKLTSLPSTFCLLEKVRHLNLSNNQLMSNKGASEVQMTVFSALKELSSLTFLDISNNNFNLELPSSLSSLINLTYLNISNNQFSSIPWQLSSLSKLTKLELSNNNLNFLPSELSRLSSLNILLASKNKINSWRSCDTLQLQPQSSSFSSLHIIDLSQNPLTPAFIVSLCETAKQLRSLNLSNDAMTTVPSELATLSSLTSLDLSHNSLTSTSFPGELLSGLKNLQQLSLAFNNLHSLPDSLIEIKDALRELDISQNPLTSVPPYLHQLSALEILRLHSDRVTVIPSKLPPKLTCLSVMNMTIEDSAHGTIVQYDSPSIELHLQMFVSFARAHPHPLIASALAFFASKVEYRPTFLQVGGLSVLLSFAYPDEENPKDKRVQVTALTALVSLTELEVVQTKLQQQSDFLHSFVRLTTESEDEIVQLLTLKCLNNLAYMEQTRKGISKHHEFNKFSSLISSKNEEIRALSLRLLNVLGAHEFLRFREKGKKRGVRILAMDGGGTRGLNTLEMLKKVEELTGKKIWESFDLICGTSTGGIIATLIGIRRYDLEKCESLYKDFARKVFAIGLASSSSEVPDTEQKETWGFARLVNYTNMIKSGSFYKTGPLLAALRTNCGSECMIDTTVDPQVTKVFAVSTLVSVIPPIPYIFRNYEYPLGHESRYPGTSRTRIFHALQGSTAAPSYFDDYISVENPNDRMQDGGISANNPSAIAVHEAMKLWPNRSIDCVVSMGTGRTPIRQSVHTGVRGVLTTLAKCATSSERIDDAIRDCFDLMYRTTDARDNGSHRPPYSTTRYFRVNPLHKSYDCPLDETREERYLEMQQATRDYIQQNLEVFEGIAAALRDYDSDEKKERKEKEAKEENENEKTELSTDETTSSSTTSEASVSSSSPSSVETTSSAGAVDLLSSSEEV